MFSKFVQYHGDFYVIQMKAIPFFQTQKIDQILFDIFSI